MSASRPATRRCQGKNPGLDQEVGKSGLRPIYGRFPVSSLRLLLVPVEGARIARTTWGYRGAPFASPWPRIHRDVLRRDWVMVHEMVPYRLPTWMIGMRGLSEDSLFISNRSRGCRQAISQQRKSGRR